MSTTRTLQRLAVSVLIMAFIVSAARHLSDEQVKTKLRKFINRGMMCEGKKHPAVSLAVIRNGSVLMAEGFGHTTTDETVPVTGDTKIGIGSLSKAFTAALLAKVLQQNGATLLTKIEDIMSDDGYFYNYLQSNFMTSEDILAHNTGVPSNNMMRLQSHLTREDYFRRLRYLRARGGFRSSFYYNNNMYGFASYLAEVLDPTEKDWETLVKEQLFAPLNMLDSTFTTKLNATNLTAVATGYRNNFGALSTVPHEFSSEWGKLCPGSGSVVSTANDMVQWMKFMLAKGRDVNGTTVLDEDLFDLIVQPQNAVESDFLRTYYSKPVTPWTIYQGNYGLGWRLGVNRGHYMYQHSGTTPGFSALLTILPDLQSAVFTSMTGDEAEKFFSYGIHTRAFDLMGNERRYLYNMDACTFPEKYQPSPPSDTPFFIKATQNATNSLTSYVGNFSNTAYGTAEVVINGDRLHLTLGFGSFALYPRLTMADRFFGLGMGLVGGIFNVTTIQFKDHSYATDLFDTIEIPNNIFISYYDTIFTRY